MTDTANLEDGFYWVRDGDDWEVAHWDGVSFYRVWDDFCDAIAEFDEIDPRPIKREE